MKKTQHVLVTHDFSTCSSQALDYGIEFAVMNRAALHFLHVEIPHGADPLPVEENQTKAQSLRENLKKDIWKSMDRQGYRHTDLELITYTVLKDSAPAPAIIQYCHDYEIDLVVMGTHGRRGLKRKLLGSVAEEVVRMSPCTVFTVREQLDFKPLEEAVSLITVPVDFSDHSRTTLAYAKELANTFEARLDILHVIEERLHPAFYNTGVFSVYDIEPDIETKVLNELKQLAEEVKGPACEVRFTVLKGHAAQEILRWTEAQKSDLIVVATHGLSGLERAVLGSVAEHVVREAPCPVITVKHEDRISQIHARFAEMQPLQHA